MKNFNTYQPANPEPISSGATMPDSKYPGCLCATAALALCLSVFSVGAAASDDPAIVAPVAAEPSAAGLGIATRVQRSLYRGGGTRNDLFPLYLYEGKRVFLQSNRLGLKLDETPDRRFELFLGYRFEGFPYDRIPASLAGMDKRGPGADLGLSYQHRGAGGTLFGEILHDAGGGSNGTEMRAGYSYDWALGDLQLKPQITLAARSANLNNYYYGVRPSEATAARPAYEPGSGVNTELGLSALYRLSERWRLIGGVSATRWASGVRASPIVENRTQLAGLVGLAYNFSPEHGIWPEGKPLIVKLLHGKSTDCNAINVMTLSCTSTRTVDQTRIYSIELGRPFIERLNGWPVDFVGYVGALRHNERGLQSDSWQANAYMKGYYYGFPWSERVRTRLGFGIGISYAQRVPFVESRDQAARGRTTSKLLNYLDPSVDFSVGDVIGVKSMRETYLGLGVSHRSGIFGSSRLLGNVDGGSNYIYSYIEWKM